MKISENDDYFKEFNNDDFIKSKNNNCKHYIYTENAQTIFSKA